MGEGGSGGRRGRCGGKGQCAEGCGGGVEEEGDCWGKQCEWLSVAKNRSIKTRLRRKQSN